MAPLVVGATAAALTAVGYEAANGGGRGTVDGVAQMIFLDTPTYLSLLSVTGVSQGPSAVQASCYEHACNCAAAVLLQYPVPQACCVACPSLTSVLCKQAHLGSCSALRDKLSTRFNKWNLACLSKLHDCLSDGARTPAFLPLLSAGVLAPLLEESVFRGFLLTSLTKRMPVWAAVLGSSAAFAVAHLSVRDAPVLFALGCLLGFLYVRSRNLLTPMLVHGVWNSAVLTLLFVLTASGVDIQQALQELR
jgi:hypothetical protein